MNQNASIILGSQSPRRLELLSYVVPREQIEVIPPRNPDEPGFEDCGDRTAILSQLTKLAELKSDDVWNQLTEREKKILITADTIIVAGDDQPVVLGKPEVSSSGEQGFDWKSTVRQWFQRFYSGKSHFVYTGVCLRNDSRQSVFYVGTEVRFHEVSEPDLRWYLDTEEPLGKAGGYAIQGAGSLFVKSVEGSLSNVIGLPLAETKRALTEFGV